MLRYRCWQGAGLLVALWLSAGCAGTSAVNTSTTATPDHGIGATRPLITLAANGVVAGTAPMGVYRLTIAGGTARLEPAQRTAALTGAKFEADLTAAMNGEILTRCPDCFRVTGFNPVAPDQLEVNFTLKHPIPAPDGIAAVGTIKNRNDLHVTNVRLVVLTDGLTKMFAASGAFNITVNADQVGNADGYTRVDPVIDVDPTYAANVFPFITLGDSDPVNSSAGNFAAGIGDGAGLEDVQSGNPATDINYPKGFNVLPQGGTVSDKIIFNLGAGASGDFSTNLVILASYIGAADARPSRLSSKYFMPEGALQSSPHIEATPLVVPGQAVDSPGSIDLQIVDFQQAAEIASDPAAAVASRDYSRVWADGRIESVQLTLGEFIVTTNDFLGSNPQPATLDKASTNGKPGIGSYQDAKHFAIDFTNAQGL
ncbi:MAG: hypothetical protein ABI743_04215, partial [bacterium]